MKTKIALSFLVPLFILVIFYLALNTNNRYSPKNLIGNKIESFRLNSLNKNMLISSDALTQNSYSFNKFLGLVVSSMQKRTPIFNVVTIRVTNKNFRN